MVLVSTLRDLAECDRGKRPVKGTSEHQGEEPPNVAVLVVDVAHALLKQLKNPLSSFFSIEKEREMIPSPIKNDGLHGIIMKVGSIGNKPCAFHGLFMA
jgi:hypothetical protein